MPAMNIQGIQVPDVVVDPVAFYQATQRQRFAMASAKTFAGFGAEDNVELRQTGIVAALELRLFGSIVVGGTIGTTTASYRWPFDFAQFQLSANGQSNLIKSGGLKLRALEFVNNPKITDRGISKSFGGSTITAGTLALASDDWGTSSSNVINPGTNVAATGTYTVDISWVIPVAADPKNLLGSIFAQTAATNLNLNIAWGSLAQAFSAIGGSATITPSLQFDVTGLVYSIPAVNGKPLVPDLSLFHQVTEAQTGGLAQNENEYPIPGAGTGRQMLRCISNIYTGSNPTPLPVTDANFGQIGWRYGGNTTPEVVPSGQKMRVQNERETGVDLGRYWGLVLQDWASENALRDIVDLGSITDPRLLFSLVSSPTSGVLKVAQEVVVSAAVGT